jgi:hypothetical protein
VSEANNVASIANSDFLIKTNITHTNQRRTKNTEGPFSPDYERTSVDERTKLPLRFFLKPLKKISNFEKGYSDAYCLTRPYNLQNF